MDSINPVETNAFIGIDPDDVLDVPYEGGIFTLGVLPVGLWDRLSSKSMANYTNAIRRITAVIHARGEDPSVQVIEGLTLLSQEVFNDSLYCAEQFALHAEAAKYGLRGHKGFRTKKGKEVPFEVYHDRLDGFDVDCVSEKTLRYYRVNPQLLRILWYGMRQLHELPDSAKKA